MSISFARHDYYSPHARVSQIRVLIERLDKTNSEASTILSAELVHQAVRDCPSLRLQKKSLKLLLDSGNEREMATYLIMSRALLSEKFDKLSQLHSVLQVQHEALIERYALVFAQCDFECLSTCLTALECWSKTTMKRSATCRIGPPA